MSPELTGVPSITNKGSLPALMEPMPLMRMLATAPGELEEEVTCTPGMLPANLSVNETTGKSSNLVASIVLAAPVNDDFLKVP